MQNIQRGYVAQYIKKTNKQKKNSIKKWMGNLNRLFSEDGQKGHEKMFNITNH